MEQPQKQTGKFNPDLSRSMKPPLSPLWQEGKGVWDGSVLEAGLKRWELELAGSENTEELRPLHKMLTHAHKAFTHKIPLNTTAKKKVSGIFCTLNFVTLHTITVESLPFSYFN